MFLTFRYAFFDTNLILWQHPQQVFYDLKNQFLKIFGKSIFFFIFFMFLHYPSKFGEISLKIGGEMICQSWPLLTPFFIFRIVQLFKMNQNNQNNHDNLTITSTMCEPHYCLICLSPYNFNKSTNHDPTTPSEWMSDCVGEDLLFSRFNFLSNMNAILK